MSEGLPTYESERAALVAEVGECCNGTDPLCAGGCLVERALGKRKAMTMPKTPDPTPVIEAARAFMAQVLALTPAINAAFAFQSIHGFPYDGPSWQPQLHALAEAFAKWDAARAVQEGSR